MTRTSAAAVALACALAAAPVAAQPGGQATPRPTRQIIFGLAPFDGGRYLSAFAPEQRKTLYLTAGADNVVTVNMTDVYYWPITGEYRADFEGFNMPLGGELRVFRGRDLAATIAPSDYIYVYPNGLEGEASRLAFGDEMRTLLAARARAVEEFNTGRAAAPPRTAYQGPYRGFVLRLEPGRYRIEYRVENQGRSFSLEKELVVFAPIGRGVRYQVIPEDKWTVSSDSDSPEMRIYLRSGQVVYVKTFPALLYDGERYDLMAFPNRPTAGLGLRGTAVWVAAEESVEDAGDAALEIRAGGRSTIARPQDFVVRQTPGSALGYAIVEYSAVGNAGTRPSFRAYRFTAPPAGVDVRLALPGRDGSTRTLRTLEPAGAGATAAALLLPLLPLALRLMLRAGARRPARRPRARRR
jgi:hypothetical protein